MSPEKVNKIRQLHLIHTIKPLIRLESGVHQSTWHWSPVCQITDLSLNGLGLKNISDVLLHYDLSGLLGQVCLLFTGSKLNMKEQHSVFKICSNSQLLNITCSCFPLLFLIECGAIYLFIYYISHCTVTAVHSFFCCLSSYLPFI